MAMEFLVNGIVLFNEPAAFIAFEEKTDELALNVKSLGFDLEKHIAENNLYLENIHIDGYKSVETGNWTGQIRINN